jgi:hypothetical protein
VLVIVTGEGVNMSFSDLFGETRLGDKEAVRR